MLGRVVGVVSLAGALVACGGKSKSSAADDVTSSAATSNGGSGPTATSANTGGASSANTGGASSANTSTSNTSSDDSTGTSTTGQPLIEPVDNVDPTDNGSPSLPEGSSGFWWGPGHLGNWFVYSPGPEPILSDAHAEDIIPPRGKSTRAYRVQASGRERGIDLYAQLDHPLGTPMDLSEYAGIAFWARLEGDSRQLVVALSTTFLYLDAPENVPSVELLVSDEWELFELPFSTFGTDAHEVANIDFVVGADGVSSDLWIDDLAFLCRDQCPTYE